MLEKGVFYWEGVVVKRFLNNNLLARKPKPKQLIPKASCFYIFIFKNI